MDSDYVFLCGVMWCKYGQQDAGNELLRAVKSTDPDLSALALAMLAKGCVSLQESFFTPTVMGRKWAGR